MKIVLGLGNPGARYDGTRHNLGFRVVDSLARRHGSAFRRKDSLTELALVAETSLAGTEILLVKPRTFMNRSGRAALALVRHYEAGAGDLLVVHDDADLELGRIRVRAGGSAGGHNGIRSLLSALGSGEFPRVKLGVRGAGRDAVDLAEYVLEEFDADEREPAAALVAAGVEAVEVIVEQGLEAAMNRFNARTAPSGGGEGTGQV